MRPKTMPYVELATSTVPGDRWQHRDGAGRDQTEVT